MSGTNYTADEGAEDLTKSVATWEVVLTVVTLGIIIIFIIVGNIFAIAAVFTYRPLRKVQNYFIVSLAVADLTVAVFVLPFNIAKSLIGKWIFGKSMCQMWLTCDIMCCTASILNLCAIALDRYWAITDPINYAQKRTLNRVMIMISLVWAISFIISFPPLLGWNDWPDVFTEDTPCLLSKKIGFILYSSFLSFYFPLILMAVLYVKIYQATKRRLRERAKAALLKKVIAGKNSRINTLKNSECIGPGHMSSRSVTPCSTDWQSDPELSFSDHDKSGQNRDDKTTGISDTCVNRQSNGSVISKFIANKQRISLTQERRLVRTLTIIMGCFVVCWLPFFLMYVILPLCPSCPILHVKVYGFIEWLGYVNSGLNPVIYTVFNKDFQKAFFNIVKGLTRNG
ncbi:probable G-protein coupled receptor No18 [Procambarus clarkii]|uniref:probable G-protein coupled receptor No18 n=1 Tax=Procambarus clarkii TaxID=6728 RepID=UPI001E675AD6|nr:probable G-protein coupled receptor No18 [Procambarus clarkii]